MRHITSMIMAYLPVVWWPSCRTRSAVGCRDWPGVVAIHPGEAPAALFAAFTGLEQWIGSIVGWMSSTPPGRRLDLVHRVGAAVLGAGLCLFGVLGVAGRLEFLAVRGTVVMGLAT